MISFLFLVPSSMLSTVSALGAQNVGAGKPERAAATLKYAICIAGGFGLIIAIIIQFTAGNVVNLFTNDQAVVYAGAQYLKVISGTVCLQGSISVSVVILCLWTVRVFLYSQYYLHCPGACPRSVSYL